MQGSDSRLRFGVDGRATFLRGRQVVALARVLVARAAVLVWWPRPAARHALRILPVQMQRKHARGTAELARASARATRRVARLTQLRGRIIVLRARALGAQPVLEHKVRRARSTLQRAFACNTIGRGVRSSWVTAVELDFTSSLKDFWVFFFFWKRKHTERRFFLTQHALAWFRLTFASLAVMMTFLATEIRHEETLRAFRVTFTGGQLPSARAAYALVSARTTASHTAQITLGARAHIAVIPENGQGKYHMLLKRANRTKSTDYVTISQIFLKN